MISATIGVINTDRLSEKLQELKAKTIVDEAKQEVTKEKEEATNVRKTSSDIL